MSTTARWAYGQPTEALAEVWSVAGTTTALLAIKLRQGQARTEQ
jgi:hypothetical protein